MKKILIKEIIVYLAIFLILALGMHYKEWFSHPIEHINSLPRSQFGAFHPLFFSFGAYLVILVLRLVINGAKKLIKR